MPKKLDSIKVSLTFSNSNKGQTLPSTTMRTDDFISPYEDIDRTSCFPWDPLHNIIMVIYNSSRAWSAFCLRSKA